MCEALSAAGHATDGPAGWVRLLMQILAGWHDHVASLCLLATRQVR